MPRIGSAEISPLLLSAALEQTALKRLTVVRSVKGIQPSPKLSSLGDSLRDFVTLGRSLP